MSSIWQNRLNYLLCKTTHLWTRLHVDWTENVQTRWRVRGTERDTHRKENQYTTTMSNAFCFYTRWFSLHNHYISGAEHTGPVKRREHWKSDEKRNMQTVNWKQTGNMILIHTFRQSLASFVLVVLLLPAAACFCWNISFSRCQNIYIFFYLFIGHKISIHRFCRLYFDFWLAYSLARCDQFMLDLFFFRSFIFSDRPSVACFCFFSFLTVCIWYLSSARCAYFNFLLSRLPIYWLFSVICFGIRSSVFRFESSIWFDWLT